MTKGRKIIMSVKNQPPLDVHRQYLDVSGIHLQTSFEVSLSNFSLFC